MKSYNEVGDPSPKYIFTNLESEPSELIARLLKYLKADDGRAS